jgi:hypothetical protein
MLALALPACLGHANPAIRDGIAFEALSAWMRAGQLDEATLTTIRADLLTALATPDRDGFAQPFAALVLSEVARTDRIKPWMSVADRDALVAAAAAYLAGVSDYRAFDETGGFRHGVAHGADLALQLALNAATTKAQLDRLLGAIATQVAPRSAIAYWAGEPDRLARPVLFIAQRNLHSDEEWRAFFTTGSDPSPLESWKTAFTSEVGIKRRHNARAFLLSVYAGATSTDDPGIRKLVPHVTAALKAIP